MRYRRDTCIPHRLLFLFVILAFLSACGEDSTVDPNGDTNGEGPTQDTAEGEGGDGVITEDGDDEPDVPLSEKPYWKEIELGQAGFWNSISSFQDADGDTQYLLTGDSGQAAWFDGMELTYFPDLETTETIRAVWTYEDGSIIVAGDNGFVRHWDTTFNKWQPPSGLPQAGLAKFNCIAGNHPSNVYIGGDNGQLYKWNGADWVQVYGTNGAPVTGEDISNIWMADDGVVFLTAADNLIWGKGIEWQSANTEKEMRAIYGFSSQNVYAGGGFGNCPQPPCTKYIYHFTAAGWEPQTTPAPAAQGINDIWGPDADAVIAISFKGTVLGYDSNNANLGWQLLSSESELSDFIPRSPIATPDEEEIPTQTLTLDRIHGRSGEDILISARKQITPPGETIAQTPGCDGCSCEVCVCAENPGCCVDAWDDTCVTDCKTMCGGDASGGEKGLLLYFTRHPLEEGEE